MKRMVSLILGLAVAGIAAAGVDPPYGWTSEPMTLDIESGTRQTVCVEHLAYDAAWVTEMTNGVTFKVSVNGAEKSQVGAYGALDWHEKRPGTYAITAQAYQGGALVGETFAATFAVAGHDLVNAVVSVDAENVIYDGTAKRPAVVVCLGGKTLVEGQDYTLTLYNNDAVGVGRMVIAGKGAYSGTVERTFRILASATCELDINDGIRIAADDETIRYSNVWSGGTNSTVRVSVKDVSVVEEKGTGDWIWTPGGVGLYTFRHTTFTEGLAGEELSAQFYVPGEMTDAAVALAFTECLYDGTAACSQVVVTQAGKTLVEGLDYTVSYALNDRPGTAVVTVRGARGETYEATFTIRPACRCALDLESGVREASANEALTYDMAWDGATSAKIAVNGAELATVAGVGAAAWQPPAVGDYTVTYRSYNGRAKTDTELSARFYVTGHDLVNAMIAFCDRARHSTVGRENANLRTSHVVVFRWRMPDCEAVARRVRRPKRAYCDCLLAKMGFASAAQFQ